MQRDIDELLDELEAALQWRAVAERTLEQAKGEVEAARDRIKRAAAEQIRFVSVEQPAAVVYGEPPAAVVNEPEEPVDCPVNDPSCEGGDDQCHNACEAPAAEPAPPSPPPASPRQVNAGDIFAELDRQARPRAVPMAPAPAADTAPASMTADVLRLLDAHPERLWTSRQVALSFPWARSASHVAAILARLVDKGRVRKVAVGSYASLKGPLTEVEEVRAELEDEPDAEDDRTLPQRVFDLLELYPSAGLRRGQIATHLDANVTHVSNALRSLVERGRIVHQGHGKGSAYIVARKEAA